MVRMRRFVAWVGGLLFVAGFFNLVAYQVHRAALGGGVPHVQDGRHYLNNHGRLTEISAQQAGWVEWHQQRLFVTCGAGVVGWLLTLPAMLAQRPANSAEVVTGVPSIRDEVE